MDRPRRRSAQSVRPSAPRWGEDRNGPRFPQDKAAELYGDERPELVGPIPGGDPDDRTPEDFFLGRDYAIIEVARSHGTDLEAIRSAQVPDGYSGPWQRGFHNGLAEAIERFEEAEAEAVAANGSATHPEAGAKAVAVFAMKLLAGRESQVERWDEVQARVLEGQAR